MRQKNTDNNTGSTSAKIHDAKDGNHYCDSRLLNKRMLFGAIILIVGFGLLFKNMFGWSFNYFWPLTIIAVGLYVIFKRKNE